MKLQTDLYAPESYLSCPECDRERVVNGCGPGGWKLDIIPDRIWGLSIHLACDIHDWMYATGTTIEDKDEADRVFLNNCCRLVWADTSYAGRLLRYPRLMRAQTYYESVRNFGGPAFWSGKNPQEELMI